MTQTSAVLDLPAAIAVRRVALRQLDAACEAHARVAEAADLDAVRSFHEALSRLVSILGAFRSLLPPAVARNHRRQVKALLKQTGRVLDRAGRVELLRGEQPALLAAGAADLAWLIERAASSGEPGEPALGDLRFTRTHRRLRKQLRELRVRVDGAELPILQPFRTVLASRAKRLSDRLVRHLEALGSQAGRQAVEAARRSARALHDLFEPLRYDHPQVAAPLADLDRILRLLDQVRECDGAARVALDARDSLADDDPRPEDLPPLLHRLFHRKQDLFTELRELLQAVPPAVLAARLVRSVRREGSDPHELEIERKFLLDRVPDLPAEAVESLEVEQGWLPGERLRERVRSVRSTGGTSYYRTVKLGSGISRIELEEETDAGVFSVLWPLTEGKRVAKTRHRVDAGDAVWEIDCFSDRALVLAEIELHDPDDAVTFPAWLAPRVVREVTDEAAFVNFNLAK